MSSIEEFGRKTLAKTITETRGVRRYKISEDTVFTFLILSIIGIAIVLVGYLIFLYRINAL